MIKRALTVCLMLGCSSPERDDIERLCFAAERAGVHENTPDGATKLAEWLDKNLETEAGKKAAFALGDVEDPQLRAEILNELAKENGYTGRCPMADKLAAQKHRGR